MVPDLFSASSLPSCFHSEANAPLYFLHKTVAAGLLAITPSDE